MFKNENELNDFIFVLGYYIFIRKVSKWFKLYIVEMF